MTFSEPLKASNLSADDFTLHGNFLQAVGVNYSPSGFSFDASGTVLTLNYTGLPDDNYTLTLLSGATGGTNFTDLAGNALDGEFSGSFPSGNGVAGGNFVIGFNMDAVTTGYPTPLIAELPQGSLIYDPTATAVINTSGDTDSYTLNVDAGRRSPSWSHPPRLLCSRRSAFLAPRACSSGMSRLRPQARGP